MKSATIFGLVLILLCCNSNFCLSQNFGLNWTQWVGGSGMNWDAAKFVEINPSNEGVIAAGMSSDNDGNLDLIVSGVSSTGILEWQVEWTYSAESFEFPSDMLLNENGKIFICGETQISFGNDNAQGFVLAIQNGSILWQQTFGLLGPYRDAVAKMVFDNDGNLILSGELSMDNNGQIRKEAEIRIYDQNGNLLSNNSFVNSSGTYQYDYFNAVDVASESGLMLAAGTCQLNDWNFAVQLVAFDGEADEIWSTIHDFATEPLYDTVLDMALDNYGNAYVLVRTEFNWIIAKFDSQGIYQWEQQFATNSFLNYYGSRDMLYLDENGNIYAAFPEAAGCNIVGVDINGNIIWQNNLIYEASYMLLPGCIRTNNSSDVLVAFNRQVDDIANMVIHVAQFDKLSGEVLWSDNFPSESSSSNEANFLCIADDGSYFYVAGSNGEYFAEQDMVILKYRNLNNSVSSMQEIQGLIYPVPASNVIYVSPKEYRTGDPYELIDLYGRSRGQGIVNETYDINISNLPTGIYFLKTKQRSDKFIKF